MISATAIFAPRVICSSSAAFEPVTGPTTAIGLAKHLLNRSLDSDRETALREEAFAAEINSATQDMKEG